MKNSKVIFWTTIIFSTDIFLNNPTEIFHVQHTHLMRHKKNLRLDHGVSIPTSSLSSSWTLLRWSLSWLNQTKRIKRKFGKRSRRMPKWRSKRAKCLLSQELESSYLILGHKLNKNYKKFNADPHLFGWQGHSRKQVLTWNYWLIFVLSIPLFILFDHVKYLFMSINIFWIIFFLFTVLFLNYTKNIW